MAVAHVRPLKYGMPRGAALLVAALAPTAPDIPRRVTSATAPVIPVILSDFMSPAFCSIP